jgi:hypothetical protein
MKKIENRKVEIKIEGRDEPLKISYSKWLLDATNLLPQSGLTPEEIETRLRIRDVIKLAEEKDIPIEDADFEKLKGYMKEMKWLLIDEAIVEFNKHINSL